MSAYYNRGKKALLENDISGVTLKYIFFDPSYTPDIDTEDFLSDVSANRASGTTDGTLANVTITVDDTNDRVTVDADDISVSNETTETDMVGIYISTGTDSTSELICYIDIPEGTLIPTNGTLAIQFDSNGIFAI